MSDRTSLRAPLERPLLEVRRDGEEDEDGARLDVLADHERAERRDRT